MLGKLDFSASLRERVALLKGLPVTTIDDVRSKLTFSPGARELCRALKRLGCVLAVLSGGFFPLAQYVQEQLQLDYAFANELQFSTDGTVLLGTLSGDIVDGQRKASLLRQIAEKENIPLKEVIKLGYPSANLCRQLLWEMVQTTC